MIRAWLKKRKKNKFGRLLISQLNPVWLFDRGNYVWFAQPKRKISVIKDQIGNHIVYDDTKMISGYLSSKEEGQKIAANYIANEIISKYYNHLNKTS